MCTGTPHYFPLIFITRKHVLGYEELPSVFVNVLRFVSFSIPGLEFIG